MEYPTIEVDIGVFHWLRCEEVMDHELKLGVVLRSLCFWGEVDILNYDLKRRIRSRNCCTDKAIGSADLVRLKLLLER